VFESVSRVAKRWYCFSADLSRALWANGAGAELFGHSAVYDLLDQGVNRTDITFAS
jgi:hypothetical protein